MSVPLYMTAPNDRLETIVRLAEARLQAQLTLGIAADQRAMTFASFLATLEAAAIAALLTLAKNPTAYWTLLAIVIGFGLATALALFSAQPVAWSIPGYSPHNWLRDIASDDTAHVERAYMAQHLDEAIKENDAVMSSNADLLRGALLSVGITLVVSAIVAMAAHG